MIRCANCETAQFLQITDSILRFDGHPGIDPVLIDVTERYSCTRCGGTGAAKITRDGSQVEGDVESVRERPRTDLVE